MIVDFSFGKRTSLHNVIHLWLRIIRILNFLAARWAHQHRTHRPALATNQLRLQQVTALVGLLCAERDSSPTPNPKHEAFLTGSSQLTKAVFNIFQSNNVLLKSSTREQLRCLIHSEIRIYETKLENLQDSISALGDQLDQLEVKDHQ